MRIVSQPGMRRRLLYRYPNWSVAPIDVWIAQPPENAVQTEVRLTRESAPPCDMRVVGENRIAHYRLRPLQTLALDWEFQTLEPALLSDTSGTIPPLDLALREWYLRASPLVSQAPEIVAEAMRLKAAAKDPEDVVHVARAFVDELVRHYTYVYPPKRRGALAMQRGRRGDCGEFSALFVAWCRAAGIPARAVVGALVHVPVMNGHLWAEFWLEGVGWVPVDPSIGQMIARQTGDVDKAATAFGHLRPIRCAFSTDLDLPLPEYGKRVHPVPLVAWIAARRSVGERPLLWGFETLDGAVPFFQPAYPRGARGLGLNALILPSGGYWATSEWALHWLARAAGIAQAGWLVGALAIVLLAVSDWLPGPVQPIVTAIGGGLVLLVSGAAVVIARPAVVQHIVQWRS